MLVKKSLEFNIELNAKDNNGQTAFHLVCMNRRWSIFNGNWVPGNSMWIKIAKMLIEKSVDFKILLNAQNNNVPIISSIGLQ